MHKGSMRPSSFGQSDQSDVEDAFYELRTRFGFVAIACKTGNI